MESELGPEVDGDGAMFTKEFSRSFHRHCLTRDSSESSIPAPDNETDAQRTGVLLEASNSAANRAGVQLLWLINKVHVISLLERTKTTEFQLLPQTASSLGLL